MRSALELKSSAALVRRGLSTARTLSTCVLGGVAVLFVTASVQANVVSFDLSIEFSGATPPVGTPPWLVATFDDGNTAGSVTLTLETSGLVSNEFVNVWMFNLDPALDATNLVFSPPNVTMGSLGVMAINTGTDAFMADGDGKFDIEIDFDNAPPIDRFSANEAVEFTITGIPTLTADSFNFDSAPAGGSGPFPVAAHVQGIGPNDADSGWITVPEPATLALIGIGTLAMVPRRRRGR